MLPSALFGWLPERRSRLDPLALTKKLGVLSNAELFLICEAALARLDFANVEALDKRSVLHDVLALEVALKSAALTDEQEKASSRVEIFLVRPQVVGDLQDALLHDCDLDFGRAGIALGGRIIANRLCF